MPGDGKRRDWTAAWALGAYAAVAFLYFAPRLVAHPGGTYIGNIGADPQIFIWSFAWWPHAILHGTNPFVTHSIWAPDGFNLAWTTSVPGLALAFAPLTLAAGPVASYNVASILMPALAAWTAFLLCRYVTRATWPSLAGGYLFGFSSYMLGGVLDHIHTTSVFLVPVAALLGVRFVRGDLSSRAFTLWFAALLAVQMSFSTEVLFTLTLALVCALVLAFAFLPEARARLRALVVRLAAAYGLAALLALPLVYFILSGLDSRPLPGPEEFVADVVNFVIPPDPVALGVGWAHGIAEHFPTNDAERGAYLGVPALLIVGWFAVRRLRTPSGRFLLASLALAALASLGSWLTVYGHRVVTLPWEHVAFRPLFENTMPVRLSMYTALVAAMIVAIWSSASWDPLWLRILLPALAVLAIVPNLSLDAWARSPHVPAFFTEKRFESCLRPGENVLIFPYGPRGDSMLWQAENDFRFRLAGGYVSPKVPQSFTPTDAIAHVTTADNPAEVTTEGILELARLKSVTSILVDARRAEPWRSLLRTLPKPREAGGVLVYHLDPRPDAGDACPRA